MANALFAMLLKIHTSAIELTKWSSCPIALRRILRFVAGKLRQANRTRMIFGRHHT